MDHFHFKSEGYIENYRCAGAERFAVATGSATAFIEGMPPMEFAAGPSDFGVIFSRNCHDVFVD